MTQTNSHADEATGALRYDQPIDVDAVNDSHALMLRMIGSAWRVLEYGCATGRMTEVLQSRGCVVTGIEIDMDAAAQAERFADAVHIIDLDRTRASRLLHGRQYDVLVFGDVLEHLRNPEAVLADAMRLLAPGGRVVASLPNMAHADVRLALLQGQVPYGPWGLLDRTHLRWFTRESVEQLFVGAGLEITKWQRTTRGISETEIPYDHSVTPQGLVDWLRQRPETTTYQFVIEAQRQPLARAAEPVPPRAAATETEPIRDAIDVLEARRSAGDATAKVP